MRKTYWIRFLGRIIVLTGLCLTYFLKPAAFSIMKGFQFFSRFSVLHLIWLIWMADMVLQLVPSPDCQSLGSQKQFRRNFHPSPNGIGQREGLRKFIHDSNIAALKIFILWALTALVLGFLYWQNLFKNAELLMVSGIFYVCDLICVLFWCPFRVFFLKNRCCTTCRIFNWDHLMMFSPLIFVGGFYAGSLVFMAAVVFLVWEATFFMHPEWFWEGTNASLLCANCREFLCGKGKALEAASAEKQQ